MLLIQNLVPLVLVLKSSIVNLSLAAQGGGPKGQSSLDQNGISQHFVA